MRRELVALTGLALAGGILAACGSQTTPSAHGNVTVTVKMDPVVVAPGGATWAIITVNNPGGAFRIPTCQSNGTLQVGLTSALIPWQPFSGLVVCDTKFKTGKTVLRWQVVANYQSCGGGGGAGHPPCVNGTIPPLPRGVYETTVGWDLMPSFVQRPHTLKVGVGMAVPL